MKSILNFCRKSIILGMALAGLGEAETATIVNDMFWKDTGGKNIYSQGGGAIKVGDTYYWYGVRYKGAATYAADPAGKNDDVTFDGVTCYSSKDLVHWKDEGLALSTKEAGYGWFGRLGVVYNAKTKKYVLAAQGASPSGTYGEYFATSSTPDGEFKFASVQTELSMFVNGGTGDQTVFQDDDGKAYIIASNVKGRSNLYVAPLRESDFLTIESATRIARGKSREGNAMFKYKGTYYFCSSDLHGWNASHTYCMTSRSVLGPYGDEFVLDGTDEDFSHVTQTGFFIQVNGTKDSFVIFAGDRWSDFAGNGLGYNQWLPISFESGKPKFNSMTEWNIDAAAGTWSIGAGNNYALNPTFEADRVAQATLAGWTVNPADATNMNSTSARRTGRWGLAVSGNKTVYQALSVPNGTYRLSVWVKSSGGQSKCNLYAKGFGGKDMTAALNSAMPQWTQKKIEGIKVTGGKIEFGISQTGTASQWINADDFALVRTDAAADTGAADTSTTSLRGATIAETVSVKYIAASRSLETVHPGTHGTLRLFDIRGKAAAAYSLSEESAAETFRIPADVKAGVYFISGPAVQRKIVIGR